MEGDDGQPSAGGQSGHRRLNELVRGGELVVHRDADGLEGPLGRVLLLPQGVGRHGRADDLHQLKGGLNGGLFPGADNGRGNGGGVPLLAELEQNPPDLLLGPVVHHRPGGQRLGLVHPHIQRRVGHVGEAPAGVVQLRGGHAQVGQHAAQVVQLQLPQDVRQVAEVAVDQGHPVHQALQPPGGRIQGGLVPVDADEPPGGEPPGNLPGVARPAQGGVHIDPGGVDIQSVDALLKQHRLVGKFHLTHITAPAP